MEINTIKGKQQVRLRAQPLRRMIGVLWPPVSVVVLMFLPPILGRKPSSLVFEIVWYVSLSVLTIVCIYLFFNSIQTASISPSGIDISEIRGRIVRIEWEKIESVAKETDSSGQIPLYWIVIKVDNSQLVNKRVQDKRGIQTWRIVANKKNMTILNAYLERYRPDLQIMINK